MSRNPSLRCWLPVVLLLLLLAPLFGHAAPPACDPSIKKNSEHPHGYRERTSHLCEGIYETGVSSLGLTLVSFTGPMRSIDMVRISKLQIQWKSVGEGEVRVRANSLRPRFYYRMDAVWPARTTRMSWTNAIPSQYELRTREFGIVATQRDKSGKPVYLPLRIGQDGQTQSRTPYVVTVISAAEIEEIYWSVAPEGKDYIVYDEPLERQPYSPNQPIAILLDKVSTPGRYLMTISAVLPDGSSNSVLVPFYHSS